MQVNGDRQVRRIGNNLGLLLIVLGVGLTGLSAQSRGEISLSVESSQGGHLSAVKVGQPFTLIVSIKNSTEIPSKPHIKGLSQVTVVGSGSSMKETMTGTTRVNEASLHYSVVARSPGSVTFGPATFDELPGKSSSTVTVEVIEGAATQDGYAEPKLTFSVDKKELYIGEKIPFVLRFIWEHPSLRPISFEMPDIPGARIKNLKKGEARTDRKGNRVYQLLECTGELYPEQAGTLTIPPLRADYSLPSEGRRWSSFFALSLQERRSTFSPELEITVHPLPATNKTVVGVGHLTALTASLSSSQMSCGEAVTLTLTLDGETDFEQMQAPSLTIPDTLRFYESKGREKKGKGIQWEYVLQGLKEGTYTLPPQEIAFFNTLKKKYETLSTQPLEITITPGRPAAPIPQELPPPMAPQTKEYPIIPWWLFVLLILIPPAYAGVSRCFVYVSKRRGNRSVEKRAIRAARKKIKEIEKEGNLEKLSLIMQEALSRYLTHDSLTTEEIDKELHERGYSEENRRTVATFFEDAFACGPYAEKRSRKDGRSLFERASTLLRLIENHRKSMLVALFMVMPLDAATMSESCATIPFIVWQLGVVLGWWLIWFLQSCSSELRYTFMVVWICSLVGWATCYKDQYRPRVRVLDYTPLRVGPSDSFPLRGGLEKHDEVVLVKRKGTWYYVSSSKGIGWISDDHVDKK